MIPNVQDRKIETSGVEEEGTFGIDNSNIASIMKILRDTLYTDKIAAVLREYSANAWDSHKMKGIPDRPIKIEVPTTSSPEFVVRDYGLGLSNHDIYKIFTQYGSSTKKNTNDAVGMMGIGSKCGFAYGDSFTVSTWHGGVHGVYVAVLDVTDRGLMKKLFEEPCADDETGVEIRIPVRPEDIHQFTEKAQEFFKHFSPRPDINIELPALPPISQTYNSGVLYARGNSSGSDLCWVALMGCVHYKINIAQIKGMPELAELGRMLNNCGGILNFAIGDVEPSASREELKYSDKTKKAVAAKMVELFDEYCERSYNEIESGGLNGVALRKRVIELKNMGLPIPRAYTKLVDTHLTITTPRYFGVSEWNDRFNQYWNRREYFGVSFYPNNPPVFILADDDDAPVESRKDIRGYQASPNNYGRTFVITRFPLNLEALEAMEALEAKRAAAKLEAKNKAASLPDDGDGEEGAEESATTTAEDDQLPLLGPAAPVVLTTPSWEVIRERLDKMLIENHLDGCQIVLLSSLPWVDPGKPEISRAAAQKAQRKAQGPSAHAAKHKSVSFKLVAPDATNSYSAISIGRPFSANWAVVSNREPTEDDLYVTFSSFEPDGWDDPKQAYRSMKFTLRMLSTMGKKMPAVYGYKRLQNAELQKIKGRSFWEWQQLMYRRYLPDFIRDLAWSAHWQGAFGFDSVHDIKRAQTVIKKLGKDHPASKLLRNGIRSYNFNEVNRKTAVSSLHPSRKIRQPRYNDVLDSTGEFVQERTVYVSDTEISHVEAVLYDPKQGGTNESAEAIQNLFALYPMLGLGRFGVGALTDPEVSEHVIQYIKMIDENRKLKGL